MINNLIVRALSGLVYVAIILISCFNGSLGLLLLSSMLGVAAFFEWNAFLSPTPKNNQPLVLSIGIFLIVVWSRSEVIALEPTKMALFDLLMVIFVALMLVWQLFNAKEDAPKSLYHYFFGLFYIGFPLFILSKVPFFYNIYEPWLLASVFILIWSMDTFAYLAGISLGKHPFFPKISPKKTWEGFVGGAIAALAIALIIGSNFAILPLWGWLGLAVVIVISATAGDLFESGIKRAFDRKDSGNFMPGHGGILDRIDSLLFALPMAFFYLRILEKFYV